MILQACMATAQTACMTTAHMTTAHATSSGSSTGSILAGLSEQCFSLTVLLSRLLVLLLLLGLQYCACLPHLFHEVDQPGWVVGEWQG